MRPLLSRLLLTTSSRVTRPRHAAAVMACAPRRELCSEGGGPATPSSRSPLLERLLARDERTGESRLLRWLGYYTSESRSIGAANTIYREIQRVSLSTVHMEYPATHHSDFLPEFEMLSLHVYLTLQRLRSETRTPHQADAVTAMQVLFDVFWTDVRTRLMITQHGLTLLASAKWVRQCERNFFAMALAFDDAWSDPTLLQHAITKHLTSLSSSFEDDQAASSSQGVVVARLCDYMYREHRRLRSVSIPHIWAQDTRSWPASYNTPA